MTSQEILIETKRIGTALRVIAVDSSSGTEVIFQAPANTSRERLQDLAASKLRYVLSKK